MLTKINQIEEGITNYKDTINIAYLFRNKSLAHIDKELLIPKFKTSESPDFDPFEEMNKHYKRLNKKKEKLTKSLYQVTEFTIEALDYMLEATEHMGAEIIFDKAYKSPDITQSRIEIKKLYGNVIRNLR